MQRPAMHTACSKASTSPRLAACCRLEQINGFGESSSALVSPGDQPLSARAPASASSRASVPMAGARPSPASGWGSRNGALDWGSNSHGPLNQGNGMPGSQRLQSGDGSMPAHRPSQVASPSTGSHKADDTGGPRQLQSPLSFAAHLDHLHSLQNTSEPAAPSRNGAAASSADGASQANDVGQTSSADPSMSRPSASSRNGSDASSTDGASQADDVGQTSAEDPSTSRASASAGMQAPEQAQSKAEPAALAQNLPLATSTASSSSKQSSRAEARPGLGLAAEAEDKFLRAQPSKPLSANPPIIFFDLETLGAFPLLSVAGCAAFSHLQLALHATHVCQSQAHAITPMLPS